MSPFILSQILAGTAICSDLASFQFKEKPHIVCCLLISCTLISTHFMLLGLWTAAGLALLGAIRFVVSLFTTRPLWRNFFILATLLVGYFTFDGLLTILCTFAATLGTCASFCKKDQQLRQIMAICTSIWICHNILAKTPGAVIMETLFLSSNLVGYFRYYIKPKKQELN